MNTVISIGRKSIILDIDILKQYYSKYDKYYYGTITEGKMIDELLKYAEDNNIYDEEIEDNLKRVEKICLDLK